MNTTRTLEDQQLPETIITIESEAQLKERGLKPVLKNVKYEHLTTIENTLNIHHGLKVYYCVSKDSSTSVPYKASFFDVYVSRFVDIDALISHLEEHGFYHASRKVRFIDGTYDDEEDCQAGASWQEALRGSRTGEAFHGGEPGKSVDASVNTHEGHYVAFAIGNKTNSGWNENIASEEDVTAYFRAYGIDPNSGWRSQW